MKDIPLVRSYPKKILHGDGLGAKLYTQECQPFCFAGNTPVPRMTTYPQILL